MSEKFSRGLSTTELNKVSSSFRKMLQRKYPTIVVDPNNLPNLDVISTGSYKLDALLNIGGLPRSKIVEVYGESGCGKSTFAGMLCASAQKQYPNEAVLYIDAEHAVSVDYFRKLGVDFDTELMYFIQPDSGEEAIDIVNNAVEAGFFSLIIVDSIPALVSKAEFSSDAEDVVIAPMAKLLARALKRINSQSSKNTLTVFINQTRETIGFGGASTPGGKNKFYFASLIPCELLETMLIFISYNITRNGKCECSKNNKDCAISSYALLEIIGRSSETRG